LGLLHIWGVYGKKNQVWIPPPLTEEIPCGDEKCLSSRGRILKSEMETKVMTSAAREGYIFVVYFPILETLEFQESNPRRVAHVWKQRKSLPSVCARR
jgi:hypothetical protein